VSRRGVRSALVAALVVGLASSDACAAKNVRKMGIERDGDVLLVSFGYTDIWDEESREKIDSGLPTTILMRMTLVPAGKKTALGFSLRNASVTYDLWEEVYHVDIETEGVETSVVVEDRDEAVKLTSKVKKHPIGIEDVPPGEYRLRVRVDRNPVSKEVLAGVKSWLKRPVGSTGKLGPGEDFFGDFITFFINKKIQKAEKTRTFRSQKFTL